MQIGIQMCWVFSTVLSLEWQPNCSLCYMFQLFWMVHFPFPVLKSAHRGHWSKDKLPWLIAGRKRWHYGHLCVRMCVCLATPERGKAGISVMKSHRKSMSYWKKKNALPRGGCTRSHTRKKKKKHTHTHTHAHSNLNNETKSDVLCTRKDEQLHMSVLREEEENGLGSFIHLQVSRNFSHFFFIGRKLGLRFKCFLYFKWQRVEGRF